MVDSYLVRNSYSQGDMVMTTTREIAHPVYTYNEISGSYILLGTATHVIPKDYPLDDEVNVHWMSVCNETLRYFDAQNEVEPYTAECKYID